MSRIKCLGIALSAEPCGIGLACICLLSACFGQTAEKKNIQKNRIKCLFIFRRIKLDNDKRMHVSLCLKCSP